MDSKSLVQNFFKYAYTNTEGKRSVFPYGKSQKASWMMGRLIPSIAPIPVLPSDTFSLNFSGLIRTGTLVAPVLDDIYFEVVAVWVPDRIVFDHYFQWLGENDSTAWTQTNDYEIPNVSASALASQLGGNIMQNLNVDITTLSANDYGNYFLNCHFGYPKKINNGLPVKLSVLPHRGYYACWNQLFRNPNWQRPVLFSKGDTGAAGEFGYLFDDVKLTNANGTVSGTFTASYSSTTTTGRPGRALLMPVNKIRDFLTTLLPEPQSGLAQTVPLLGEAPIIGVNNSSLAVDESLIVGGSDGYGSLLGDDEGHIFTSTPDGEGSSVRYELMTDLSNVSALTIENLREAVMAQHYKEMLARGGQYADDILNTFFGVSDSRIMADKVEILCHKKFRVGVNQVVATADSSNSDAASHLGETGAYSVTGVNTSLFTKSFTEHGQIYIFHFCRHENTYAGGFDEEFTQVGKFDRYWSPFDHLGETGVPAYVLNAESSDLIIGYQEAWYMYRTQRNKAVGALDVSLSDSKDYWTLGTAYSPIASSSGFGPSFFIQGPEEFDRALLLDHTVDSQFISDIRISGKMARRMSPHSNPGIFGLL